MSVGAGTYPSQSISGSATSNVSFTMAGPVTISGDLTVTASHVVVAGANQLHLRTLYVEGSANHDAFSGIDAQASPYIFGAVSFITITGGDWGPGDEPSVPEGRISPAGSGPLPHDITLDGLYIHDHNSTDLTQSHNGGFMIVGGYNLVLRNNRFERNVVYDIEVDIVPGYGIPYPYNVTLENNFFAAPVLGPPYGSPGTNDGQPEVQITPGRYGMPVARLADPLQHLRERPRARLGRRRYELHERPRARQPRR